MSTYILSPYNLYLIFKLLSFVLDLVLMSTVVNHDVFLFLHKRNKKANNETKLIIGILENI